MTLSKWIVGALALAGCGWAGATWLHGERAVTHYNVSLEAFGERHGVELANIGYERDLLSSVARTRVMGGLSVSQYSNLLPVGWRAGSQLVFKHEIQHGPLVVEGGVKPLAARIVTTLDLDALNARAAAGVRDACDCDAPFRVVSDVSHGGDITHAFTTEAMRWFELGGPDPLSVHIAATDGRLTASADGKVEGAGELGSIVLRSKHGSAMHEPTQWSYRGVQARVAGLGTFEARSAGLRIELKGGELALEGFEAVSHNELVDGKLNGSMRFTLERVDGERSLGPSALTVAVRGVPEAAVVEYASAVAAADMDTLAGREQFLSAYLDLFEPGVSMQLSLSSKTASGHDAKVAYDLAYVSEDGELQTVGDLIGRLRSGLDVDVELSWLNELGLDHLYAAAQHATVLEQDRVTLDAKLADGLVRMNGDTVPVAQMLGPLVDQALPSMQMIASQWMALEAEPAQP
ncbi:MAG: DUF945 family protein [Pseudomonadota bacterium]